MIKKHLLTAFCLLILSLSICAQKISKPTLTPTPPTESQQELINQGIKFHDAKNYDAAIEKYKQVLDENPNCDLAWYELALSYYNKKDFKNTIDAGAQLIKYNSKTGLLGYGILANVLDDQGNPNAAINVYKDAIKILEGDPQLNEHVSSLYYNLGVTHFRQKQYKESRESLKKAVPLNFKYPSPNFLLAEIYNGTGYKVPALLAASRLISLEYNTVRTQRAVAIFQSILKKPEKDEKTGSINIFMNMNAPKDEGDFGIFDLFLGTLMVVDKDKNKDKSEIDIFADAIDSVIALLDEDKKYSSTFVGKTYIPFMAEMKKRGFTKPFACIILKVSGNPDAEKWIVDNNKLTLEFVNWSRSYEAGK